MLNHGHRILKPSVCVCVCVCVYVCVYVLFTLTDRAKLDEGKLQVCGRVG